MWNKCWLVIIVVLCFTACKTKKRIVTSTGEGYEETAKPKVGNLEINNLDFRYFSGRAKSKLELGKVNQDVTLNIRIQRDQKIWISVTALLGIEAARVMITPDSIQIINKLQGEYIKKPFSYIYQYVNRGVTFLTLQDLLIANVSRSLLRTDQLTMAASDDEVQLAGIKDQLSFQYSLNKNLRPKVFRIAPVGTAVQESLETYYGDYAKVGLFDFPHNQQIKIGSGTFSINALLDYNKVEFSELLDFPFAVPARYRVIE